MATPETFLIWPDGAPGAVGNEDSDKPSVTVFLPDPKIATGTAVVLCPGGGYAHVAVDHEGKAVADWFNSIGVATFMVRYRIAPKYHHPAPLSDAQEAVRIVRTQSHKWGIDPGRIGVMGFSAGGHLASCVGTIFDEHEYSRPDFMILVYPVITLNPPYAHMGSRANLLVAHPDEKLINELSTETRVTKRTPPTFLIHTGEDAGVPCENSIMFYTAMHKAGVPGEMHIYPNGPHGFGLGFDQPSLGNWPDRLKNWMEHLGLLKRKI